MLRKVLYFWKLNHISKYYLWVKITREIIKYFQPSNDKITASEFLEGEALLGEKLTCLNYIKRKSKINNPTFYLKKLEA